MQKNKKLLFRSIDEIRKENPVTPEEATKILKESKKQKREFGCVSAY